MCAVDIKWPTREAVGISNLFSQRIDLDGYKLSQEDCMAWYHARMRHMYTSLLNFGEGNDMFPQLGPIVDVPGNA